MAPHIKPALKSAELTSEQPTDVRRRLETCLASDPGHIVPGSSGPHVLAVQNALRKISAARAGLGLPDITDPPGQFGETTTAAVNKYKDGGNLAGDRIVRAGQQLDDVVGRMTITQIDDDLVALAKPKPAPPPQPRPAPLPVVGGSANVFVGFMGRGESRADIILDYYKHCGLETIGPAQLETSSVKRFSTFEGLIDELIKTATFVNIVVNHGDFANGLLIKFCPESNLTSTSKVIGALSELADRVQNGTFNPADPGTAIFMKKVTSNAQISQPIVMRIVSKLIVLRTKPRIVHLRACRMEFASIVMQYKTAFRALAMSFHGTRIIFQRIDPLIPRNGKPVATIVSESGPNTAERRLRKFEDSLGEFATMMIGVGVLLNEDGDVIKQDSVQLIDRRDQVDLTGWAELLVRRWKGPLQKGFVIPIMWADKDETTYHCPLETGWRQKIQTI